MQNTYATMLQGLHGSPVSFDLEGGSHGTSTEQEGETPDTQNTSADGINEVQLSYNTDYDQAAGARNVEADPFHLGMQPFAVEFWMRPDDVNTRQLILDLGAGAVPGEGVENAANQVRVYLDNGHIELRIDDPIYDSTAGGINYGGYVIARSSDDFPPLETDVWHHVAVAATGTYRDEIAVFIDGIYDENMAWEYHYVDDTGAANTAYDDSAPTVQDSYFWPVAMEVPNDSTVLASDVAPTDSSITLNRDIGLPPDGGMIMVLDAPYKYDTAAGTTVTLPGQIGTAYSAGDGVAPMIPLVQTDVQWQGGTKATPGTNHRLGLWGHSATASGSSYNSDAAPLAFDAATLVDETEDDITDADFPGYFWVGFLPNDFPLQDDTGTDIDLGMDNNWKAFNYTAFTQNSSGVLAGVLPSGPLGDVSIGGDRNGANLFTGQLDEVRVTALPTALVESGGASGGSTQMDVEHWLWNADDEAELEDGATCPVGAAPMPTTGGYFLLEGELYSYTSYDDNSASPTFGRISGIEQLENHLLPSGTSGLATGHSALHRIVPLTFMETTTLANDFPDGALPGDQQQHIAVEDNSAFPPTGYVQIGGEVIGYSGKDTNLLGFGWDWLLRPRPLLADKANATSAFPRGAYGTTTANHTAGDVVRHVPVRAFDRYRFGTGWADHDDYSNNQLTSDMCMFSFALDAPDSQLRKIRWRLKEPMEAPQRLVVMVNLDPAGIAWDQDPDDTSVFWVDDTGTERNIWGRITSNTDDDLWGFELDSTSTGADGTDVEGVEEITLFVFDSGGEHPTIPTRMEMRCYFDFGLEGVGWPYRFVNVYDSVNDVYNVQADGWETVMELDTVGVEMVPKSTTF
jgi:hypothetical protein